MLTQKQIKMPTKEPRHTCIYCNRKLIESKMETTFGSIYSGHNRHHWKCKDEKICKFQQGEIDWQGNKI